MNEKPTLEDLGLDAPVPLPGAKKSWQQIADEADDSPSQHVTQATQPSKWNGAAAVMSFLVPGLGQIYKGHVVSGIVFFATTLLGYAFIIPGVVVHLIAVVDAGNR